MLPCSEKGNNQMYTLLENHGMNWSIFTFMCRKSQPSECDCVGNSLERRYFKIFSYNKDFSIDLIQYVCVLIRREAWDIEIHRANSVGTQEMPHAHP